MYIRELLKDQATIFSREKTGALCMRRQEASWNWLDQKSPDCSLI